MSDEIEEIKMIMIRDKNLEIFDTNRDKGKEGFSMEDLHNVECLLASHNLIRSVVAISQLSTLRQLNLSFNQLTDVSGIENLTLLEELHLNNNRIIIIDPIMELKGLKQLGLFNNELIDSDAIIKTVASLPKLKELSIDGNPGTRNIKFHYEVLLRMPKLRMLNEDSVKPLERDIAARFFEEEGSEVPGPTAQKPKVPASEIAAEHEKAQA
jgi:Leucine-rich repeat (LRR) protein